MSNALANLVFEIVSRRLGDRVLRQEMSAGVGNQLIAPNRHGALFVDEFEAVHAEVGGRRVAHWRRIPCGQERLRGCVRLLEGLNWRRRRDPWLAAGKRQEELLKLLGVLRRKAVVRMGNKIGVTAVGETKPDGEAAWLGPRIRIGDLGYARVGREAHRDRHLVLEMQRLAHARRLRARKELAEQDDTLGVGRPLRRLLAERRVERIDERFGGRGHRGLLLCVHRRPPLERSLPASYASRVLAFKPSAMKSRSLTSFPQ